MGIFKHKDIFKTKFPTAMITTNADRVHFVPIKHTIGDYFVTVLDGMFYVFTLRNARILIYRETMARTIQVIQYDTTHFASLQAYHKELEQILYKENLPKVDRKLLNLFRLIGLKEKAKEALRLDEARQKLEQTQDIKYLNTPVATPATTPGDLNVLMQELSTRAENNPQVIQMIQYIKDLDRNVIVTPVRRLAENLQGDLITTSPSFLGELVPKQQRLASSLDVIVNKPVTAKVSYLKMMIILSVVGIFGGVMFYGYEIGLLDIDGLLPDLSGVQLPNSATFAPVGGGGSAVDCSDEGLQSRWPNPIELKVAIESGQETCTPSSYMEDLLDDIDLADIETAPPVAVP